MGRSKRAETTAADSSASSATGRAGPKNGSAVRAAAASAPGAGVIQDAHGVRFHALENIAYHAAREQFFALAAKALTGLQVLLGTSAVGMIAEVLPGSPLVFVVLAALTGVLLLVYDPAAGAREHRILRGRYHDLVAEMDETVPDATDVRRWRAAMSRIAAGEPPVYRAVQAMAYNAAVNASYPEELAVSHRYKIGWLRVLFAHFWPMRGMRFQKSS